jgi:hypothetical protein
MESMGPLMATAFGELALLRLLGFRLSIQTDPI